MTHGIPLVIEVTESWNVTVGVVEFTKMMRISHCGNQTGHLQLCHTWYLIISDSLQPACRYAKPSLPLPAFLLHLRFSTATLIYCVSPLVWPHVSLYPYIPDPMDGCCST